MTCNELRSRVDAFVDQELSLELSLEIETHLEGCTECRLIYTNRKTLQSAIQNSSLYETAPDRLYYSLMRSINNRETEKNEDVRFSFFSKSVYIRWIGVAASLVIVGFVGWYIGQNSSVRPITNTLEADLFASDFRALMAPSHGIDIISSNQHTVKPWFAGRLDFSPPVQDFSGSGYPLLGGRRDYLDGKVVAALVYKRRQHWINLYIWPNDDDSRLTVTSYRGYNLVHWSTRGMTHWAVSDLNPNELTQFAHLVQSEN